MTAHGKLDEDRLPAPNRADRPGLRAAAEPATELEQRLTVLWREVLRVPEAGVQDNFFDLGGTSLTLAVLHHRLRTEFALDLPIHRLFEYPTIRALAQAVTEPDQPSGPSSGVSTGGADPRERAALARRALAGRRPRTGE